VVLIVGFRNIILKKEHGVPRLVINRPDSLNSLNRETLDEIRQTFQDLRGDTDVRVVVISGAGGKAFSVGADLKGGMFSDQTTEAEATGLSKFGQKILKIIEDFEKPVVAAIDGYALGGGFELALACDLIIASQRSLFGQVEINLGLILGWGGSQRLARIVGRNRAKAMILTGDLISAEEAERIGIVSKVVPTVEFEKRVDELVSQLASKSSTALALAKSTINRSFDTSLEEGLEYESQAFAKCFATLDYKERLRAFLKKHEPT
jgi:enoyl-CoA hydratase